MCYLDLDNFKPINDEYGHSVGDYLLIDAAQRLKTCVRAGDTVACLGGDEFVLLIGNLEDIASATTPWPASSTPDPALPCLAATGGHFGEYRCHPLPERRRRLRHPCSATPTRRCMPPSRPAATATTCSIRKRPPRPGPPRRGRIREGLARNEFRLHYQPKVDMRKGMVIGAEALIRWQHPERGLLLPGTFLPAIEGSDLAIEIGDWVINETLRQMDAWRREHGLELAISINISGDHLQHPRLLPAPGRSAGQLPGGFPG